MQLRPLGIGDLSAASNLLHRTNYGQSTAALIGDLVDSVRQWPSLQIGAFDGGNLVGLVAGRIDAADPGIGHSDDIVLNPEFQRTGLGSKLLQAQLAVFAALGCRRVRGLSPRSLYGALPFFERHGFKIIQRIRAKGIWGIADGEEVCITEKLL